MKKWLKILFIMMFLCVTTLIFSACTTTEEETSTGENATLLAVPSEIKVEGYFTEVNVGDEFFISPIIQQKKNGKWVAVPTADYVFECEYDGTQYGNFDFVVYLKDYPHVKFEDSVKVLSHKIKVPTFSTIYTGSQVDVKTEIESKSEGFYEVIAYSKMTNVGKYSASLQLTDPKKCEWINDKGEVLKGKIQKIDWEITKAESKEYSGNNNLTVYYGETLFEIAQNNNLDNIFWSVDPSTKITNQTQVEAVYNESIGNYEDTNVVIYFDEIIRNSHYKVEFYLHDGEEYILDMSKTLTIVEEIGKFVVYDYISIDGYQANEDLSQNRGIVLKQDGLILKLYYDISE